MTKLKNILLLFFIFIIALSLRIYGIDWDQGQHLHPDERFLTMVISTISRPQNIIHYFSTSTSPLNPYNHPDYQFFVYGTFPLFITKYIADFLGQSTYDRVYLLGRFLSALFDSLNIITLFFLSRLILKNRKQFYQYLPSLFYAFTVLPIQLSHFFAVDTFLNFFILLTFTLLAYYLQKSQPKFILLASISFGLALACKISAFIFVPIIGLIFFYLLLKKYSFTNLVRLLVIAICCLLITFLTFRFFQPYSFTGFFTLNQQFISNIKDLQGWSEPSIYFPPSVQWLSKTPLIFPFQNLVFWGLGLPQSILFFISSILFLIFAKKNHTAKKILTDSTLYTIFLSGIWIIFLFFYQGLLPVLTMRYFFPIYPFISILLIFSISTVNFPKKLLSAFFLLNIIYSFSFLSIYSRPHSRVQASRWIYQNILPGSTTTNEYWDDALPLSFSDRFSGIYQNKMLPLYDPDTPQKWEVINSILNQTDYIFLTSNRLWGSIPQVPDQYPVTSKFYNDLFDGYSQFSQVAEFNSYPGFSLPFLNKCYYFGQTNYPYQDKSNHFFEISNCNYPGIYLRDDTAEESFTVYDHPKVLIFQNNSSNL